MNWYLGNPHLHPFATIKHHVGPRSSQCLEPRCGAWPKSMAPWRHHGRDYQGNIWERTLPLQNLGWLLYHCTIFIHFFQWNLLLFAARWQILLAATRDQRAMFLQVVAPFHGRAIKEATPTSCASSAPKIRQRNSTTICHTKFKHV